MKNRIKPDSDFINRIGRYIYNISIRMLWHPQDAEDATQEILIKVVENIESFKGDSKVETWIYRIAVNHLLKYKQKGIEEISFEDFSKDININYSKIQSGIDNGIVDQIYIDELKISCTHALLQCLDKEHRIIFILSSIFDIDSTAGSQVLDIEPANYRKKLSRAKKKIKAFMESNCGLYNPDAACSCRRRLPIAIERNRVNKDNLLFVNDNSVSIQEFIDDMNELDEVSQIYKSSPFFELQKTTLNSIVNLINKNDLYIFQLD